jgi:hypothetical protein
LTGLAALSVAGVADPASVCDSVEESFVSFLASGAGSACVRSCRFCEVLVIASFAVDPLSIASSSAKVSPNAPSSEEGDSGRAVGAFEDLGGGGVLTVGEAVFGADGALVGAGADIVAGMVVRLLLCS